MCYEKMEKAYSKIQEEINNKVYKIDKFLFNKFGFKDISSMYTKNRRNNR